MPLRSGQSGPRKLQSWPHELNESSYDRTSSQLAGRIILGYYPRPHGATQAELSLARVQHGRKVPFASMLEGLVHYELADRAVDMGFTGVVMPSQCLGVNKERSPCIDCESSHVLLSLSDGTLSSQVAMYTKRFSHSTASLETNADVSGSCLCSPSLRPGERTFVSSFDLDKPGSSELHNHLRTCFSYLIWSPYTVHT